MTATARTGVAQTSAARTGAGFVLPCLTALFLAGSSWEAGLFPWQPALADLRVYVDAAAALLTSGDPYAIGSDLPFIYPPFAAILAIPLTWLPWGWASAIWTVGVAAAFTAILSRFGLSGWRLSLISTGMLLVFDPVRGNVEFGQVGVLLAGLVVADLLGRDGKAPKRSSWSIGVGIGIAAAIKLTPGLFAVYLLVTGRWRSMLVAFATFLVATVVGAIVAPGPSWQFWTGLAGGDTGVGPGLLYLYNQSLVGAAARILGYSGLGIGIGLALAAATTALGLVAAVAWHRRGDEAAAVILVGIATLLASPVSWFHHFVWIAPLAALLVSRRWPAWVVVPAWLWVGWVARSPFNFLPSADLRETTYLWWQVAFSIVTPVVGLAMLALATPAARRVAPDR